MTMHCNEALPLVWSYLDGELSEAQAQPLRKHLLECHGCRGSAQDGRSLKRWFTRSAEEEFVPEGFAARIARRAFAGDTGERAATVRTGKAQPRHLSFVLALTAAAAAALITLSVALRFQVAPVGGGMRADDRTQLDPIEVQRMLDRINASEKPRVIPVSETAQSPTPPSSAPNR